MRRPRRIDLDQLNDYLLDSDEAAAHLGLADRNVFLKYVRRHADELQPALSKGRYIRLWLTWDLDAFQANHRVNKRRPRDADADPS